MSDVNVAYLLVGCLPIFIIAYLVYGRYLGRVFGEAEDRETPAVAREDGKDYVPANPLVLSALHLLCDRSAGFW